MFFNKKVKLDLNINLAIVIPCTTPAAGAPANTIAEPKPPEADDPVGEEVIPPWYGGAPSNITSG